AGSATDSTAALRPLPSERTVSAIAPPAAGARKQRRAPDWFRTMTLLVAAAAPALLLLIVAVLLLQAGPALAKFGPGFIHGRDWNPVTDTFGALPAIFGTVATSLL